MRKFIPKINEKCQLRDVDGSLHEALLLAIHNDNYLLYVKAFETDPYFNIAKSELDQEYIVNANMYELRAAPTEEEVTKAGLLTILDEYFQGESWSVEGAASKITKLGYRKPAAFPNYAEKLSLEERMALSNARGFIRGGIDEDEWKVLDSAIEKVLKHED